MPKLNRDGVNIHYEIHGSGPPLLLTHGYSSTSAMWQGQIAALSKQHTLILWDMRGHGQSDYPDDAAAYSEALTVGDMAALLDEAGAGSAIVGGLSLGGYMSLAFYRAHPERVRALLIIDTGPGFKKDEARDAWNKRAHETGDRFEREGLEVLKSASRERSSVVHRDASGLARAARGMLTQRDASVIETLPHIKVPALVVVGADDTPFLAASDYMAAKIPGAKKVVIPAAGHAANIDQPQAFIDAVLPFLDSLPRQALRTKWPRHEIASCAALLIAAISGAGLAPARAQQFVPQGAPPFSPPFIATLSNNTPLAFGMSEEEAARALGTPLNYISGRPGDEIFLAFRHAGGTGFFNRKDRLYLQFRRGRLAGWKGDWGRNWMWQ